ncbi:hypothetical protein [Blastococcus brunescens]|uniref:Uncharacterized protein n=1 Tax=Blastococcus brunescens TaxID=1564165 RepID=A0ABZ1B6P0_9ACTN|nr:hypothetical protein [Blastococcus sp. BMG 8361]WRL66485.1 hypothetical protein U6N30_14370 [Blastococcus sp. BMG 8361]
MSVRTVSRPMSVPAPVMSTRDMDVSSCALDLRGARAGWWEKWLRGDVRRRDP